MSSLRTGAHLLRCCICVCLGLLLLAGAGGAQTFYEDVTAEALGASSLSPAGLAFGDYDNDGWPDLFIVARDLDDNQVRLLHNEGNGRFVDHTATIRADISRLPFKSAGIFADYDDDGDLDLYGPWPSIGPTVPIEI